MYPGSSEALKAGAHPLRQYVWMAAYAFAGTVDSTRTVRLPIPSDSTKGYVATLVHLSRLEVAKGDSLGDRLTLRMYGGIYGGVESDYVGQTKFKAGSRYVLLTSKDLGEPPWFMPIVGGSNGVYPVHRDSIAGAPVVHDSGGSPVLAVSEGHIVILERRRDRPADPNPVPPSDRTVDIRFRDEDDGKRMAETEFLTAIRNLAAMRPVGPLDALPRPSR